MTGDDTRATLGALWSPILAVTTVATGRTNGQIAIAGLSASILREAPRILIGLWKANLTHDMVLTSGVLAAHLLPGPPEDALDNSLSIVRTLGFRSGRDGDKMAGLRSRSGTTGSPILIDALSYVEGQVVGTLDAGEMTIFLADVVSGAPLRTGMPLTMQALRALMPGEWMEEWEANQESQRREARRLRRLDR